MTSASAAAPAPAAAQIRDTTLEWHTIRTPHFEIHYHEPLGFLARRVAAVAERAQDRLVDIFGSAPSGRVQVLLSDDSDSANGSAIAVPYDAIRLYVEPPEDLSPLGDYDDWLTSLVTHEHTHIVHLDQAYGLPAVINAILGRIWMPNHVNPRWLLEGYAVWQETESTAGGRLRSTQWDMWLRMDVLEGREWSIDQVTTTADRWPHGHAAYLYGSYFIQWIADHFGRETLARIAREYAESVLPYGTSRVAEHATGLALDPTAEDATGFTFVELWDQWLAERRTHDRHVLEALEAEGRVEGRRLTQHGEIALAPRYARDGRLYYVRGDNRSRYRVVFVDEAGGEPTAELARVDDSTAASVHPDGSSVYFSRRDFFRDSYYFGDLVRRDLASGDEERLTHGLRAREPDVSPDGRHVAFTTTRAGTTRLMVAETRDVAGTMRELVTSERFEQAFTPRYSPDGTRIAYSRWQRGGYRDVVLVDVETGRVTEVTHDRALDTGPAWSPDGRVLYFSSDRTGIANIYAYRLETGLLRQVTNVIAGAYSPAPSPDGERLAYLGYTSYGFDVFLLEDLSPEGFRAAPAYVDRRPPSSDLEALYTAESSDYDPLPTLWPRSYLLDVTPDSFGSQSLGVTIRGEDIAGFHSYELRAGIGLSRGQLDVDIGYAYQRSQLGVSLGAYRHVSAVGGLWVGGEERAWIAEQMGADIGVSYGFPRSFRGNSVHLGYGASYTWPGEPYGGALDPNTPPPSLPVTGLSAGLRFGWSYSDVEAYAYDVSLSNGRSIGIDVGVLHPLLGSDHEVVTLTWGIAQYIPIAEHHVLALRYAGGISGGDLDAIGIFGLGGYGEFSPTLGLAVPASVPGTALRGYPVNARIGTQYHLAQVSYRFPIVRLNAGVLTVPIFLNRLHAEVFCDVGDAFLGPFDIASFRVGAGAEIFLDFTLFYVIGLTLRVGYAHGFMEGGADQVYANLGRPF